MTHARVVILRTAGRGPPGRAPPFFFHKDRACDRGCDRGHDGEMDGVRFGKQARGQTQLPLPLGQTDSDSDRNRARHRHHQDDQEHGVVTSDG